MKWSWKTKVWFALTLLLGALLVLSFFWR